MPDSERRAKGLRILLQPGVWQSSAGVWCRTFPKLITNAFVLLVLPLLTYTREENLMGHDKGHLHEDFRKKDNRTQQKRHFGGKEAGKVRLECPGLFCLKSGRHIIKTTSTQGGQCNCEPHLHHILSSTDCTNSLNVTMELRFNRSARL